MGMAMTGKKRSEIKTPAKHSRDEADVSVTRRLRRIFYAALVVIVAAEPFLSHPDHAVFFWHTLPGFDALYGFMSCVVVVLFAKALGRLILQRREDFYDD
jgi:hypothetical protein